MSLDIDRINGLLNIVKEASGHPSKLSGLVAMAMKELEGHSNDAKKEHDKIIADENKEIAAKRQDELNKQAAQAAKDAKSAELTLRPHPTPEQIKADRDAAAAKQKALDEVEAKRLADQAEKDKEAASAKVSADGPETVHRPRVIPAADFDPEVPADTYIGEEPTEVVRRREVQPGVD